MEFAKLRRCYDILLQYSEREIDVDGRQNQPYALSISATTEIGSYSVAPSNPMSLSVRATADQIIAASLECHVVPHLCCIACAQGVTSLQPAYRATTQRKKHSCMICATASLPTNGRSFEVEQTIGACSRYDHTSLSSSLSFSALDTPLAD